MTSIIPTSEVLNLAADLIERRGWTTADGWNLDEDHPLCLEGAISAAMGADISSYGGFTGGPNLCPAGRAVRDYLGLGKYQGPQNGLFNWNDESQYVDGELVAKRDATQVVSVLRSVAVIEAARESELSDFADVVEQARREAVA